MRKACRIAAQVLEDLSTSVEAGVNTYDLDQRGRQLIADYGATSTVHNYRAGSRCFPAFTCISVNEEIVHGIGSIRRVLKEGDIITLDVTVTYKGFIGDNARTLTVGRVSDEIDFLVRSTEKGLSRGISKARSGYRVGDISFAVQRYIEGQRLSIVRDFVGHGVGRSMHEEPQIPNFGRRSSGERLQPGMTLAIEPMVNLGRPEVDIAADGWTALTRDRLPSAHFEHTVLITNNGPEILTTINK